MPISTGRQKLQTKIMKGFQRPRQYIYHHCQLGHVSPGLSLLISVCVLMLPMLGLADERVQLMTTDPMNHIHLHQCHGHTTSCHAPLFLPSLNNIIPAMVLQNRGVKLKIGCPPYTSSHSVVSHALPVLHLNLPPGLGRTVVGVVFVLLLLLLSGDIETNPGPDGEFPC